jgi:hypothetical protein
MTDFISNVLLTDTSLIAFIVANLAVFVRLQLKVNELQLDLHATRLGLSLLVLDFQQMLRESGEAGTPEHEGGSDDT